MENTKKSLLKWSDVFYVYEKIREIESGKESLGWRGRRNWRIKVEKEKK